MERSMQNKRKKAKKKPLGGLVKASSLGADLLHLDVDKSITLETGEYAKRRALKLTKKNNSWGFTLQTYGIKHKKTNDIEVMTYVDYVDIDGAAFIAGMRRGDVILAVNGEKVSGDTHKQLVNKIRQTEEILRLVVNFEDCCKKVELHETFLKLKAVLQSKIQELKLVELEEIKIYDKYCTDRNINRFDMMRQSIVSKVSSNSDSWDAYSVVSSPYTQKSTGHFSNGQWSSVSSVRSFNIEESSSTFEDDSIEYIDSDSDSLNFTAEPVRGRSSDSDLVNMKNSKPIMDHLNTQTSRLSRSFDAGINKTSDSRFQDNKKPETCDDHVFIDESKERVVPFEEAEQSYVYTAGSSLHRKESTDSDKIYYKGENGKMIVPKICVEGEREYTTFDQIDTETNVNSESINASLCIGIKSGPGMNSERLQEKIVAIEIAKEMAKIEKMVQEEKPKLVTPEIAHTKIQKSSPKRIQKSKSQPLHLPKIGRDLNIRKLELSPRLSRSNMAHIGGSLSYEKLKSSVPDIVISFHAEDYQIVYINEGDQNTKL